MKTHSEKTEPFTNQRLFCPGPTPVPLEAKVAALSASGYHRTQEFFDLFLSCREKLSPMIGGDSSPLILTSSGTGAMEAAIVNLTNPGDRVLTVSAGKFGDRWMKLAEAYECAVDNIEVPWGEAATPEMFHDYFEGVNSAGNQVQAVFFQANETSTGVYYPIEKIMKVIRAYSECLVVVDAISALGAHEMKMSEWGIDCVVSGSQKGFGIPPGLAFISLSDKAWKSISSRPKFYFDLMKERAGQDKGSSAWTPATSLVASLSVSLAKLHQIGLSEVISHHKSMAQGVRLGITAIGLELFAKRNYSHSLTSVVVPSQIDGTKLLRVLATKYGAVFAGGQDHLKGKIIRFAHLGFVDRFDVLVGMAALEFALADAGHSFEIGVGVSAFMKSLE